MRTLGQRETARICTGTDWAHPRPHLHGDHVQVVVVMRDRPGGCARHICVETGRNPATSAPGLALALPHLRRDWAHPCHMRTRAGLTPATSTWVGLGSPQATCTRTGLTSPTSARGLRLAPAHICAGTGLTAYHICIGTEWAHPLPTTCAATSRGAGPLRLFPLRLFPLRPFPLRPFPLRDFARCRPTNVRLTPISEKAMNVRDMPRSHLSSLPLRLAPA
jgi:hypothetical protein